MSLFGTNTGSTPLFGTTTAQNSLFGTSSTPNAAGTLFGTAPTSTTAPAPTGGLFGSTTTTAPATSGSLFGTTPVASSAPTLFGSTSAAPASTAAGTLFGGTAPATTAASSLSGGLFGAKPAAITGTLGGGTLFGAPSAQATSTPGSLFGTTTPSSAANTTLGLGGDLQQKTMTVTTGTTVTSLTGVEKETAKDGEILGAAQIRELLPLIEEKLRKNREIIEEVENMPIDNSTSIDEVVDKTRGWINEVRRSVRDANDMSQFVGSLVSNDKSFVETAKKLQEATTTSNQQTLANTIKKHLFELTDNYDSQMAQMQQRVEAIRKKFERLINGEPALTMEELDEMFKRCDSLYANAQYHIHGTGREVEALKNILIEQGYTNLRKTYGQFACSSSQSEGAEFFPSQSSLAIIGSSLRAPSTATSSAVGGLGLGTGTGLFGSTGGTSLFGSTTASKPAFSGGSLFGNLTNTAASSTAAPVSTATTNTSSLFPSFNTKPTTTFASTVTNNSSGLLFSMKK